MKRATPDTIGIYLREDGITEFLGDMALLGIEGQARQLGMPYPNLYRAYCGHRLGDRAITGIMTGVAAVARRRGVKPPAFESLFELRTAQLAEAV
jgi:hypothetical protein